MRKGKREGGREQGPPGDGELLSLDVWLERRCTMRYLSTARPIRRCTMRYLSTARPIRALHVPSDAVPYATSVQHAIRYLSTTRLGSYRSTHSLSQYRTSPSEGVGR
eukprot:2984829-Rhodomonas_salina.1